MSQPAASAALETINPVRVGAYAEPHRDLRHWLARVEAIGELQRKTLAKWGHLLDRPSAPKEVMPGPAAPARPRGGQPPSTAGRGTP
ncbi:MAG: hypothetical protein ACT4P2_06535 [Pseudomonadota bacterium]